MSVPRSASPARTRSSVRRGRNVAAPIVFGALGVASGAISGLIPFSPGWMPAVIKGVQIHADVAPLHTPFAFAVAIYCGLSRWDGCSAGSGFAIGGFSVLAWLLAINTALTTAHWVEQLQAPEPALWLIAGPSAGLVGSAVTMAGVTLVSRRCRNKTTVWLAIIIGGVAGLCLNPALQLETAVPWRRSWIVLFTVWQGAVAASIGGGLARATSRVIADSPR